MVARLAVIDVARSRRLAPPLAVLAASLLAGGLVGAADDADAARAKLIGKTKRTPKPSCPQKRGRSCEAIGRVTALQTKAAGRKGLMKIRRRGHLVAWSVDVSRPDKGEREFFGEIFEGRGFGTNPSARLGVIRRKKKKRYKLIRQSPAIDLRSFLGERPIITMRRPLRVRKGDNVALTVPTWISNFAVDGVSRRDVWRGSRRPDNCEPRSSSLDDVKRFARRSKPQEKKGSLRNYRCRYTGARVLYWAYFVRKRAGGKNGGD